MLLNSFINKLNLNPFNLSSINITSLVTLKAAVNCIPIFLLNPSPIHARSIKHKRALTKSCKLNQYILALYTILKQARTPARIFIDNCKLKSLIALLNLSPTHARYILKHKHARARDSTVCKLNPYILKLHLLLLYTILKHATLLELSLIHI